MQLLKKVDFAGYVSNKVTNEQRRLLKLKERKAKSRTIKKEKVITLEDWL